MSEFEALDKYNLKTEQEQAVKGLLSGKDVLAVLPTGFGKSLIFQTFASVKSVEGSGCVVLVITPLSSIIQDQLNKLNSLVGFVAVELSSLTEDTLRECRFNVLFGSAELLNVSFFDEVLCIRGPL